MPAPARGEEAGSPLRVAVIGAGPAGVYASDILLRQLREKGVDLGLGDQARID
ncbi:MAG: glutamate synthase, partial [Bifidobacteriales bacterium]|nr:glutamate synthase [Bifidobacteriales bacterium]